MEQSLDLNLSSSCVTRSFFTESCITTGEMIAPSALATLRFSIVFSGFERTDS